MSKWLSVFWDDLEFLDSKSSSSWKLWLQCLCIHHAMDTMWIYFLQTSNPLTTNCIFHIHAKLLFVWLFFWKPLFPYPLLSREKCPNLQLHPCEGDSPVRLEQWNTSTLCYGLGNWDQRLLSLAVDNWRECRDLRSSDIEWIEESDLNQTFVHAVLLYFRRH